MKFFAAFVLIAVASADVLDDVLDIEQDRAYKQTQPIENVLNQFTGMIKQGMGYLSAVKKAANDELNAYIEKQALAKTRLDAANKALHGATKHRDVQNGEMKAASRDLSILEETATKEKALLNVIISKVNELEKTGTGKKMAPVALIEESQNNDLWSAITEELARPHPQIAKLRGLIKELISRINAQVASAKKNLEKETAEHKASVEEVKKRSFSRSVRLEEYKRYVGYTQTALENKKNADEAFARTQIWSQKLLAVIAHIRTTIKQLTNAGNTKATEVKCYKEHGKGYCKAKLATEFITLATEKSVKQVKKMSLPEMLQMLLNQIRQEIKAESLEMEQLIASLKKTLGENVAKLQRALKAEAMSKAQVSQSEKKFRASIVAYKTAKNLYESESVMRTAETKLIKQISVLVETLKKTGSGNKCLPKSTMSALQTMVKVDRDVGCNPTRILALLKDFVKKLDAEHSSQKEDMVQKYKVMKKLEALVKKAKALYSLRITSRTQAKKTMDSSRIDYLRTVEFNEEEKKVRAAELKAVAELERLIFKVMLPMGNHNAGLKQKKITEVKHKVLPKA